VRLAHVFSSQVTTDRKGTRGANPYTARVRYIVLQGVASPTGAWAAQRRRIADDFRALFGQESQQLPPRDRHHRRG